MTVRWVAFAIVFALAGCTSQSEPHSAASSATTSRAAATSDKDWGTTDPVPTAFAVEKSVGADGGTVLNDFATVEVAPDTWAAGSAATIAIGSPLGQTSGPYVPEVWGAPVKVDHEGDLSRPVTITWQVADLSTDQQAAMRLVRWDEDLAVWAPSSERIVVKDGEASVHVSEFSIVDWITTGTLNFMQTFGQWTGKRAEAPQCKNNLPSWVKGVVRPDEDLSSAALRTCVESDKNGVITVRVANNRSHATLLTLGPEPTRWAWVWTGEEDSTPMGGLWSTAHDLFDKDKPRALMPAVRTMAFGVARPSSPGPSTVTMSAAPTAFTIFGDVLGMGLDSLSIGGMDNPVLEAFVQGVWACGGQTLAQSRPNSPDSSIATAIDAVRGCAGGIIGVDSRFADAVGTAYEDALRAQIAKGGKSAEQAIKIGRALHGLATKLALLKIAEIAEYVSMLLVDLKVGATTVTLRLEGTPQKLGVWTPGCKSAAADSGALYKNLALQDQFADKSKDLWQFSGWAAAATTAVKPLVRCAASHRELVAKDVEKSWGDKKAAAIVAKAIRAIGAARLPQISANSQTATELRSLLMRTGKITPAIPIQFGCEVVSVLGANLASGDADVVVGSSLCDGDVLSTWYIIRGGRVTSTGWGSMDAGVGDVAGLTKLLSTYENQDQAAFDFSPADETWELIPRS